MTPASGLHPLVMSSQPTGGSGASTNLTQPWAEGVSVLDPLGMLIVGPVVLGTWGDRWHVLTHVLVSHVHLRTILCRQDRAEGMDRRAWGPVGLTGDA